MLNDSTVTANIPAADLNRARAFYADVDQEVKELRDRGVQFEHYDMPGMTWDGDVASAPEMGKAAWFKDSEGNILCIDDLPTP